MNAKYLTKLDLAKGYLQLPIREEDRDKTAFSTPVGQYRWATLPFGFRTLAQCSHARLLQPLKRCDVDNFIEDIATEMWEQHLEALDAVLSRLEQANMSARPSKCWIGFT